MRLIGRAGLTLANRPAEIGRQVAELGNARVLPTAATPRYSRIRR